MAINESAILFGALGRSNACLPAGGSYDREATRCSITHDLLPADRRRALDPQPDHTGKPSAVTAAPARCKRKARRKIKARSKKARSEEIAETSKVATARPAVAAKSGRIKL